MNLADFKIRVHRKCVSIIEEKAALVQQAIQSTRDAVQSEGKSSVGDKYETGRAMMHLEQEKLGMQQAELQKQMKALAAINPQKNSETVEQGSLIKTDKGLFYIAVGLSTVNVEGQSVLVMSPLAPLAKLFIGLKKGEVCSFMKQQFILIEIS
jgi:hypothetical protein